jgi:D-proline reductase (dithiol) PrdB
MDMFIKAVSNYLDRGQLHSNNSTPPRDLTNSTESNMPFSMKMLLTELTGKMPNPAPVFDPPALTPLRKSIAKSKIGMFVSCGAQLPEDPPLAETEDLSFRLLPRDVPLSELVISHKTAVRKWAEEDLNVAYPLDRMKELEAEEVIGGLAHTAVSMVGSIQRFTELLDKTVPAIKQVYDSQGVDLVLLFPF